MLIHIEDLSPVLENAGLTREMQSGPDSPHVFVWREEGTLLKTVPIAVNDDGRVELAFVLADIETRIGPELAEQVMVQFQKTKGEDDFFHARRDR